MSAAAEVLHGNLNDAASDLRKALVAAQALSDENRDLLAMVKGLADALERSHIAGSVLEVKLARKLIERVEAK